MDSTELELNLKEVITVNPFMDNNSEPNLMKSFPEVKPNSSDIQLDSTTKLLTNKDLSTDSQTINPLEGTNDQIEDIRTENTINGQKLRIDDMIVRTESTEYNDIDSGINRTDTFMSPIETNTLQNHFISDNIPKNDEKYLSSSENQTITSNEIEITTEILTTSAEGLNVSSLESQNILNSIENNPIEKSKESLNFVQNISLESLNGISKTIPSIENNGTKESENETSFDSSVGVILQGIIHAIDKQLQRRIPAEPRLKNNSFDEILDKKELNDTNLKTIASRSENKAGLPSLSSSFFITDDNEKPYKSDSDGVEIITAKTAFYDFHESPGDSILINLTPSSLKVSASPSNQNPNPSNNKNFDIMAQNNRVAIYGRPSNPFPQPYLSPTNDWKAVNTDFGRRPVFDESMSPSKPIESLYYNENRRHDSDETLDQNNSDFDKKPRLDFEGPIDPNNRMKVIPFKVNDAVAGLSQKRKNGSFLIRVSTPNKNILNPDSNPKPNQQSNYFYYFCC